MKTYTSSNSRLVNLITFFTFILFVFISFILIFIESKLGSAAGGIFLAIVLSTAFYFYSQSLIRIQITDKKLILKKNLGRIQIDFSDIHKVVKLKYADIPMTIGSKGFFGFIGQTMDGSRSFVKNRKQMVQIITNGKKYLISCDNREDFIEEINRKIQE